MDMDIDMDIDLNLEADDRMEAEAEQYPQSVNGNGVLPSNIRLPDDPISQDVGQPILDKVHVRGLDNMSSADVKQYTGEHYSLDQFERIEWIDDTSANLIFSTAQAASEALSALTNKSMGFDPATLSSLQLRPAKKSSLKSETELFIRQGSSNDIKKKGAHEASRYYLMNPEQDPRERQKHNNERRPRGRRGSDGDGEYNRRRYDDREHKRRRDDRESAFDASMYDDDEDLMRDSSAPARRKRPRPIHGDEDLFAHKFGRPEGRLRGRSASPLGDGDGRMGFGTDSDQLSRHKRARQRSRSPRAPSHGRNAGKELFPIAAKSAPKELFPAKPKELFPNKDNSSSMRSDDVPQSPGLRKSLELFPNKRGSFSNHRRTGAFDASSHVRAEIFAQNPPPARERSLADRITGRPATAPADENIRIRGAADSGTSIRGAAANQRELFPMKAGNNAGKELFGEKIRGRGGPRRKAEDMFL